MATIQVDEGTVAALKSQAAAHGLTVDEYLRRLAVLHENAAVAPISAGSVQTDASKATDEFDRTLDELFAGDNRALPETALTYSREDIYLDHD